MDMLAQLHREHGPGELMLAINELHPVVLRFVAAQAVRELDLCLERKGRQPPIDPTGRWWDAHRWIRKAS
jgi:hypothetical protein